MKQVVNLLIFTVLVTSCKKTEDRSCWKSAGNITDTAIYVNDFTKLSLNENMSFQLIQDSLNKIELHGGKNLLSKIQIEQASDGSIEIKNLNKCNFLRYNSEPVLVKIHIKSLNYLAYRGTKTLMSPDTLHLSNFQFFMNDGAGSIDLKLNVANSLLGYISHGAGDFKLAGNATKATFNIMTQGSCDTRKLIVQNSVSIVSNANAPCYINAENISLKSEITGQGNVYYLGTPTSITSHNSGVGKLIKL
jgi:hypothetical protein